MEFVYGFSLGAVVTSIIFFFIYKGLSRAHENTLKLLINDSLGASNEVSKESLLKIIDPLKEKVEEYKSLMTKIYETDLENTSSLKTQLNFVLDMGHKMEVETKNLTEALKGDSKTQGDWGEMILSRCLESVGFEQGREYSTQFNIKDEHGSNFRPDAVIHLPENHCIVIDSKVSLKALAEDDNVKLKKSLLGHIDDLSSKSYQTNIKSLSPDFVVMFIPLEKIMPIIFSEFPEIFEYAAKKNIVLATPISLLPILKTIGSLWRVDRQNKNSQEIAKKAGILHDKFLAFVNDFDKLGKSLDRVKLDYEVIEKRLHSGNENLIVRAGKLKELGAQTTKVMN